jgi:hypothetical protein
MTRSGRDDERDCPCLTPTVRGRAGVGPESVYCRLASGRVRVPTRAELASRCTAGRYQSCPGYRRWVASRQWAWRLS